MSLMRIKDMAGPCPLAVLQTARLADGASCGPVLRIAGAAQENGAADKSGAASWVCGPQDGMG